MVIGPSTAFTVEAEHAQWDDLPAAALAGKP